MSTSPLPRTPPISPLPPILTLLHPDMNMQPIENKRIMNTDAFLIRPPFTAFYIVL